MPDDKLPKNTDQDADKEAKESAAGKPVDTEKKDTRQNTVEQSVNVGVSAKKIPSQKSVKETASSKGKLLKKLALLLLIICLVAIGVGGYWLYQNRAIFDNNFEQELAQQRELLGGIQQGLEREKEQRLRQGLASEGMLSSLANDLASQQQRVRELGGASRTDWLLAEAEFLLRLGNQRLVIERDAANAKALLGNADVILRDLDEVDLLPVRKALAKDITALALVENIDREGLYFRLSAIAEHAAALPIIPSRAEPEAPLSLPVVVDQQSRWQQLWRNFVSASSRLVNQAFRIQHHEKSVKPLLSTEQQQVVRATLSLVLEQAQVALLRQETRVYQQSLDKALTLLRDYYAIGRDLTPITNQIETLKGVLIEQPALDISTSLSSLKTYIDNRHARHNVGEQEIQ